jgi:hypothetical protein
MADSDSKDLTTVLTSRGQAPVLALVLILAATVGALNFAQVPPAGMSAPGPATPAANAPAPSTPPPPAAGNPDALEALEPLYRFLNLDRVPHSLEELSGLLGGYRITTLIATISDPKESRLSYDFDLGLEAIQRAIESEGYTLDRSRLPWLDADAGGAPSGIAATGASPTGTLVRGRHQRQPGTILFRIDRSPPAAGRPAPPQELLLLLIVGETPTWGIQQEAFKTSLDIAWTIDFQRNSHDAEGSPAIKIVAPTFSGSADSLARTLRTWAGSQAPHASARIWVCSGAATAVDKPSFESNAQPAQVIYAATVIPDELLLRVLYRFLARPAGRLDPSSPLLPRGKIALLVESGSGYGSAVGNTYGTSGTSDESKNIISIPFPSQIAQVRASTSAADATGAAKNRPTIPFDAPPGRQSDSLPALAPRITVASDSLILSNILTTIANEDIRYVGIVATDILDVIYLTRLIRENCPDVQIILVGNDLRYTDPRFTLDFRGTVIVSSYPLDARAQIWSYPFKGAIGRRLFANEFDVGRYNAALVLLNAVPDPNRMGRLVVDASRAEDFLVYGKPFSATTFDSVNRRPQIWINQVGQFNVWPLKVRSLSHYDPALRGRAEALIPPIQSLNPQAEATERLKFPYDFPLFWKMAFAVGTFVALLLVALVVYTNWCGAGSDRGLSSVFDPLLNRFSLAHPDRSRRSLFLITLLIVALAIPYSLLATPLDIAIPPQVAAEGERDATLVVSWDVYALCGMGIFTLVALLLPLGVCLREVFRSGRRSRHRAAFETDLPLDHWLVTEDLTLRAMVAATATAGIACIVWRLYQFALLRPEIPNDWLALDRSAHLLGGISPIVPVSCLGAAIFWWAYLELKKMSSYPLLRRGTDLISETGIGGPESLTSGTPSPSPWHALLCRLNARYRLCVDLLEYPVTVLISKNLPLFALVAAVCLGLVVFVWGVVWPRYLPTPEGIGFDILILIALLGYFLLLLYSQVRYLWLSRSLLQLFRQLSLLPMAGAFDRIPPRVVARFGRFLRTSLQDDIDLEIPLQQCRLVLGQGDDSGQARPSVLETVRTTLDAVGPHTEGEFFELVSTACAAPVIAWAWPSRSLGQAYGGAGSAEAAQQDATAMQGGSSADETSPEAPSAVWLNLAEELMAARIVYLVSQFAGPLRSMSAQLIYGPILLLLAVAWYPFHPMWLMSIAIWVFIGAGVLATLMLLVQIERNDFVSRVARTAPNALKLDQTFISNLLPYAVPAAGFLFTAFPSLSYWLGSLLEPIGRALR